METDIKLWLYVARVFLKQETFQTAVPRKSKHKFASCNSFTFFENRYVCELKWKNIVQPDRAQMKIWRVHFVCWIPKTTNTHSEYVTLIAFALQQWLNLGACTLRYWYTACPVLWPLRITPDSTISPHPSTVATKSNNLKRRCTMLWAPSEQTCALTSSNHVHCCL